VIEWIQAHVETPERKHLVATSLRITVVIGCLSDDTVETGAQVSSLIDLL